MTQLLQDVAPTTDALTRRILEGAFEPEFYLRAYGAGQSAGWDALGDYIGGGWRKGRDPAPWFSSSAYLETYPDVAEAGVNPFHHYLMTGFAEGRRARPSAVQLRTYREDADVREVLASEFDAEYYLGVYPDVAQAGLDPLQHYMERGWSEGRDPNAAFSTRDYLDLNPDVAASGMNPFHHYIIAGRREARRARSAGGFRFDTLRTLTPVPDRAAAWRPRQPPSADLSGADLAAKLFNDGEARPLFVGVSHDDFTRNLGGVQLCLRRESRAMRRRGYRTLHLHPAAPLPIVEMDDPDPVVGLLIDDAYVGRAKSSVVAEVLRAGAAGRPAVFAVHSLLGHGAEATASIGAALRPEEAFFWVHDFASVCDGFNLLRNDVQFCGAPPIDSLACELCVYGPLRRRQVEAHARLFDALPFRVVAPSAVALETWRSGVDLPAREMRVHPHCSFEDVTEPVEPEIDAPLLAGGKEPLRVAFLGVPGSHKGWNVYEDLARRFWRDERYRFLHLGLQSRPLPHIEFHRVEVSAQDDRNTMIEAVERHRIDVAVIWSLCRETFCFAAHEAVAGGAAVITMTDSGNVVPLVQREEAGQVLRSEAELFALFDEGEAQRHARAVRRPRPRRLVYSALTGDLVPDHAAASGETASSAPGAAA